MRTEMRKPESPAAFYAEMLAAQTGISDDRLQAAFAAVPRERFLGPGPWPIATMRGDYIRTPSADPAFIYADVLVGLIPERGVNNGEPSSHFRWLHAAGINEGDKVAHVGAGVGYYTAIIAELAGKSGRIDALEIDPELADRGKSNLASWPWVNVFCRSGLERPFAAVDVIYVSAGLSAVAEVWLDALSPGGRLVMPLTAGTWGSVMRFTARGKTSFDVKVVSPAGFIPCIGGQDKATAERLAAAYGMSAGGAEPHQAPSPPPVHSLHRRTAPDDSCWFAGDGWWLSTRPLDPA